jgi:hypothetical protein
MNITAAKPRKPRLTPQEMEILTGLPYMRKSPRKTQEIKDEIMNIYELSTEEERQTYDKYSKLQPSKQLDYISSIYSTNRPSGRKIMKLKKIN